MATDLEQATKLYWESRSGAQRAISLGTFGRAQHLVNSIGNLHGIAARHGMQRLADLTARAEQDMLCSLAVAEGVYPLRSVLA